MWPQDHNSPSKLHIPGDRFIPTRSLMDIEHARSLLVPIEQRRPCGRSAISPSRDEYIRRVEENLTKDPEGKPFRMLEFRGSPSKCSKNGVEVDEEGRDLAVARRRARKLLRIANRPASYCIGHKSEVCGLKWSDNGNQLASAGNDQLVNARQSSHTSKHLHRFRDHSAAVKALARCPFRSNFLASGDGTGDHCIKISNVNLGKCVTSIDTGARVCALEWNRRSRGDSECPWVYSKFQSPDGSTVVSAGADELLHFCKIFEPPSPSSSRRSDDSDSPFSLKSMHVR